MLSSGLFLSAYRWFLPVINQRHLPKRAHTASLRAVFSPPALCTHSYLFLFTRRSLLLGFQALPSLFVLSNGWGAAVGVSVDPDSGYLGKIIFSLLVREPENSGFFWVSRFF